MRDGDREEFGELAGLAQKLRGADLSADSRVKDTLKAGLLARRERWRLPVLAWLLPAAAAAALFVLLSPGHSPRPASYPAGYALPDDGYGPAGRQGLGDYQAAERF